MGGDFDVDRIFIRDGSKVQFELDYIVEFQDVNRRKIYDKKEDATEEEEGVEKSENFHYEDVEPNVHIKAINLVSEGLDFLEMSENTFRQMDDQSTTTQNETFSIPKSSSTQNQF